MAYQVVKSKVDNKQYLIDTNNQEHNKDFNIGRYFLQGYYQSKEIALKNSPNIIDKTI